MEVLKFCKNRDEITGPIDIPIINNNEVTPTEISVNFFGVDAVIILNPPTCKNDIPIPIITKLTTMANSEK